MRDMQFVPFHIIDLFDELDDKVYAFEQLFLGVINEHAPMKQTMIRGNQVPYMTEQWRKAIRHRHKLWKNSRAIERMQITRHTNHSVILAPLSGEKQ